MGFEMSGSERDKREYKKRLFSWGFFPFSASMKSSKERKKVVINSAEARGFWEKW